MRRTHLWTLIPPLLLVLSKIQNLGSIHASTQAVELISNFFPCRSAFPFSFNCVSSSHVSTACQGGKQLLLQQNCFGLYPPLDLHTNPFIMPAFIPHSPFLGVRSPRRQSRCRPRTLLTASVSPDVVVIGAGIAGLSTAYELAQKGASVHVLTSPSRKSAANASAGMLAPDSESLSGNMRSLCRVSHRMYPDFVRRLERLVDIDVHYVARNDFLVTSMTPLSGPNVLTEDVLRHIEPALGPKVKAARRGLGDASVDSRRLMRALHEACIALGVNIEQEEVQSVIVAPDAQSVQAVQTKTKRILGGHYLITSGAWTSKLLPGIPIRPVKGQMLSLTPPESNDASRLNHVIHGPDVYIVPKNHGNEFYIGATVEQAGFDSRVTAGGINQLLNAAIEVVPKFAEYEIAETWAGLRPATPDLQPILGHSEYKNVTVASGYYRNGILLAPATASIAAAFVLGEVDQLPSHLRNLADKFSYQRLLSANDEAGVHKDSRKEKRASNSYMSPQTHSAGAGTATITADKTVKLWQINEDGTEEPVYPSQRFLRDCAESNGSNETTLDKDSTSPVSESLIPDPQLPTSTDNGVYQGGEGFQSHIENLENISGENDAYEDVMRKRDIADEVMSRAMAKNRAFGRKKSYLETEGSVPLSISEEEAIAFDAALSKGIEDMRQLEKHFDPNDPSVCATKAEKERMEFEIGDVGLPVNGVAVPSFSKGGDTAPGSESSGGYF